jgi:LAO/AO transport system kinase
VESSRSDHRDQANELTNMALEYLSNKSQTTKTKSNRSKTVSNFCPSFRIALSGSPGVGKSTFIESFGMMLVEMGHKVAVLAVDPSSSVTGGSILGDKTRMSDLSRHEMAYVRPSASSGHLGGVARNTSEAILLCEAAGYDIILVETVGVGQSETMVSDIVDMFTLLIPPAGGDELQGIKKGIVELADIVLINKADGDLLIPAQMTQIEYVSALKLLKAKSNLWRPKVVKVSSINRVGINDAWESMLEFYYYMNETGAFYDKRSRQRVKWMWRLISDSVLDNIKKDAHLKKLVSALEIDVSLGKVSPGFASQSILDKFYSQTTVPGESQKK